MPFIERVNVEELINIGIEAVNAGNIFLISEPHSGGGGTASDIVKSIIEQSSHPGKLILEVPNLLQNQPPETVKQHIIGKMGYSDGVEELPIVASENRWSLFNVDAENQLDYSKNRQDTIVENIKNALQFDREQGCIILFGWKHICGFMKPGHRMYLPGFNVYLTDSVNFDTVTVYSVRREDKTIRAHIIPRININY